MLKQASYKQFYQRQVLSTYKNWTNTLSLIKQITDPKARQMFEDDLQDIYNKAQKLMEGVSVHPPSETYLKLILSRPLEQWIIVVRNAGSVMVH
jgi:hypothetical protein